MKWSYLVFLSNIYKYTCISCSFQGAFKDIRNMSTTSAASIWTNLLQKQSVQKEIHMVFKVFQHQNSSPSWYAKVELEQNNQATKRSMPPFLGTSKLKLDWNVTQKPAVRPITLDNYTMAPIFRPLFWEDHLVNASLKFALRFTFSPPLV